MRLAVLCGLAFFASGAGADRRPPVVHFAFEDALNDSGAGFLAKKEGDGVEFRPGVRGRSLFVGGAKDWVDVEVDERLRLAKGFTVEMFLKRDDWENPYKGGNCSQTVVALNGFDLDIGAPCANKKTGWALRFRVGDRSAPMSYATPEDTVKPNVWYHLALVVDPANGEVRLYMDGTLVFRDRGTPKLDDGVAGAKTLRLGTWHEANQAFRGAIDEFKIYDYPRTGAEIRMSAGRE